MRLTKQTDYALRTLMYCAVNEKRLSRVSDIARAYSISELFLFKLIRPLVNGGLLRTTRGRHGGIQLALPAEQISVLDAVKLTEESFALTECFEKGRSDCPLIDSCAFNGALQAALAAFFNSLSQVTIADLVMDKRPIARKLGLLGDPAE